MFTWVYADSGGVLRLRDTVKTFTAVRQGVRLQRTRDTAWTGSQDHHAHTTSEERRNKQERTSRQTQAGIDHSAPTHRGGDVQNRSRRREQPRGRYRTEPQAEQPRGDLTLSGTCAVRHHAAPRVQHMHAEVWHPLMGYIQVPPRGCSYEAVDAR